MNANFKINGKEIETKRLILRPFELDDAESMFNNWASDEEVTKYLTWNTHKSIEETKSVLAFWVNNTHNFLIHLIIFRYQNVLSFKIQLIQFSYRCFISFIRHTSSFLYL